jgi:hypothetical protein
MHLIFSITPFHYTVLKAKGMSKIGRKQENGGLASWISA